MMIDTGEELDIVYTTNSLIVTTPTGAQTSMMIAKQESEIPLVACFPSNNNLF